MISLSLLTIKLAIAYAPLSVILFYRRFSSFIIPLVFKKSHNFMQCSSVIFCFSMWITVGLLILQHFRAESKKLVIGIFVLKITSLRSFRKRVLSIFTHVLSVLFDLSVFNCYSSLSEVLIMEGFKCCWIALFKVLSKMSA